jgi:hypothetical protein
MRLHKWDPKTELLSKDGGLNHFKILLVGRSGSGKSVCMRDLLSIIAGRVDLTLCFSPTQESCDHFRQCVPGSCVYQGPLRTDVLAKTMETQRSLANAGKRMRQLLICCDDCSYDKSTVRGVSGQALHDYAYNGRHQRCCLLYCAQSAFDLPPDVRSQVTHTICTVNNQHQEKRKLWQAFGGVCKSYREFDALMTAATRDYGVLVMSNSPAATLEESVFFYRAKLEEQKPYQLCKPVFWKLEQKVQDKLQREGKGREVLAICV